jgi:hypothetical protein
MRITYKNEKQNKKTSAENENIIKNLNTCFFFIYKTKIGKKQKKIKIKKTLTMKARNLLKKKQFNIKKTNRIYSISLR